MSRATLRLIVAFLLAVWLAPSVGALSMGLHLVLEHGGLSGHDGSGHPHSSVEGHFHGHHSGSRPHVHAYGRTHGHGHSSHAHHHPPNRPAPAESSQTLGKSTSCKIGHSAELVELLEAVTHGHHHESDVTPDHDHDATFGFAKIKLRPDLSLVAAPHLQIALEPAFIEQAPIEGVPRRGPPTPLFTSHCSLLL